MGGGVTRIIAAVGVRGFATTVQYDLGENGANGIYAATMPASGCPTFTSIASNANGFVYGTAVTGSPYATGANMNAGSGVAYVESDDGQPARPDRHRGRAEQPERHLCAGAVDRSRTTPATAAARPAASSVSGRRRTAARPGRSWPARPGPRCGGCGFDYPQNWYDQGLAVDPNNAGPALRRHLRHLVRDAHRHDVQQPHLRLRRLERPRRARRPARARLRARLVQHPAGRAATAAPSRRRTPTSPARPASRPGSTWSPA